jgi:hypothetical protein
MAARLAAVLPRFAILTVAILLATATITFAAQRSMVAAPAAKTPAATAPETLIVPDVRGQAYVFAKGILEDGGFAWRVKGAVEGYAANTVSEQTPAPGTRVVDTGAPTIVLRLRRNRGYAQQGTPENAAPFTGTALRLHGTPKQQPAPAAKPTPAAKPKPAAKPEPAAKPKPAPAAKPAAKPAPRLAVRPPAFAVRGAPEEPADEMSLPARARRLEAWLGTHRRPTSANVSAYLYQHAWIVTGARFGWWHGEEALRLLLRADRRAQRLWGIGAKSERVTRQALRFVAARSR